MKEKQITVADLDPMTPRYKVVDEDGYTLGKKMKNSRMLSFAEPKEPFLYLKPECTKRGQRTGGKHGGIDARLYRSTPPLLKAEIIKNLYVRW